MTNKVLKSILFVVIFLLTPSYVSAATLSLSPASSSVANGSTFDVQIILNTQGVNTSGTDVQLLYDASKLNILDITNGSIYDQYVGENINNTAGTATISGLASSTSSLFTGTGTFATVRFRAVGSGTASVSFIHTPGNKNDTNVANFDTQEEALTGVTNGSYTITGGSGSTSTGSTGTSTGTTTTSSNNLPVTASSLPLVMLVAVSLLLVGSAIYLYKHFKRDSHLPPAPPLS